MRTIGPNSRQLFRPRRSHAFLRQALEAVFGERRFGESTCRLVIPTYDAVGGRIYLFKTPHLPRFFGDKDVPAVEVAMATAAAPTYFAAHEISGHGGSYIDGGVWANCPALVGVVEAVHFPQAKPEDTAVLSIGTTSSPFFVSRRRRLGGVFSWNKGLVDLLMQAEMNAALAQVELLAGLFHRIDTVTAADRFSLDDSSQVKDLVALGRGEARKKGHQQIVSEHFLNGSPVSPFQPSDDETVPSGQSETKSE